MATFTSKSMIFLSFMQKKEEEEEGLTSLNLQDRCLQSKRDLAFLLLVRLHEEGHILHFSYDPNDVRLSVPHSTETGEVKFEAGDFLERLFWGERLDYGKVAYSAQEVVDFVLENEFEKAPVFAGDILQEVRNHRPRNPRGIRCNRARYELTMDEIRRWDRNQIQR